MDLKGYQSSKNVELQVREKNPNAQRISFTYCLHLSEIYYFGFKSF